MCKIRSLPTQIYSKVLIHTVLGSGNCQRVEDWTRIELARIRRSPASPHLFTLCLQQCSSVQRSQQCKILYTIGPLTSWRSWQRHPLFNLMRGLAFPSNAVFDREDSYDRDYVSPHSSNVDAIPIDPALSGPTIDPAITGEGSSKTKVQVSI